ncbi:two-component system, chemotaxis family, sensor kinase CheA [Oceanospirillum multiglobuliferum]|uniref:Chemotaxis protein CheA n=1 Tax=Oceanospirillum multiglobuliferum TaxID=64969 RepID=A0A1T4SHR7_9GAMM|nr:Hpt domain-containing protein [Oceanospirillum multiglobuliferum]OPX54221.1 hypothetical protein BTE48_15250 [Oceanospirillum multiglobuliferum]SKA27715.1 two-component system, chemotaxis family, sensor kinase CheA [Oceanospirillum multiglobuliferum]
MSFDLSQFNQLFFEETAEHLATMESLMLNIDVQSPDMDDMNAVFRAAHSIKGNSGTFGFHDMADVTHELETLLDLVRKGETSLTDEMVDVTLKAGDVLSGLLNAHQEGLEPDLTPSKAVIDDLHNLLAKAKGEEVVAGGKTTERAMSAPSAPISEPVSKQQPSVSIVTHSFVIGFPDIGEDTNILFESLQELGELTVIDSVEAGGERWLFSLRTDSSESDIKELISFIVPPDQFTFDEELSAEDGSFGFFEDVGAAIEKEVDELGYGFFDDLDSSDDALDSTVVEQDAGYGFFDEDDGATAEKSEANTPNDADSKSTQAEVDPGYGFFDDLPEPSDSTDVVDQKEAKATPQPNTNKQTEFDGYGFFEPVADKSVAEKQEKPAVKAKAQSQQALSKSATTPAAKNNSGADSSIRVSVEKVDQLINQVGELVITQAMLAQIATEVDPIIHERMVNGMAQLERNTRDLQEAVMSIRMMPISFVFSRFPRVVRDLASKLNKKVKLELVGENTELDRSMIEKLADPLTHLIRNSLDHGIESPDTRAAQGKDETGTILLRASHQGGNIVVEVQDDGGGLNRERILSKAMEKGLPVSESMPDSEIWQLIFAPGFSTAAAVTDVSGRGVGMDVVKRNIISLGGRLEIESIEGIGTRISIRLPLTLAILDGLSVALGDEIYIIPLTSIIGSMQPEISDIKSVSGEGAVIKISKTPRKPSPNRAGIQAGTAQRF